MPVRVDEKKCNGCGVCEEVCPGDVIRMNEKRKTPYDRYPDDCWYCGCCAEECPNNAIEVAFPYLIR
jgi:NAD-dependent dihydropyrimidine dehydrogenase PreA subunit